MSKNSFDCIVIGSGPGGYVAAIRAAQLGLSTAVIERETPGGVCLNWGCIPTKALLKSAEVYSNLKSASDYGLSAENVSFDYASVVARSRKVVERMTKGVDFLLKKNHIEYIQGTASFKSKNEISVTDAQGQQQILLFKNAIIATGARPRSLPSLPVDGERIITSREALALQNCPERLLVLGAGAIGIEFAYLFSTFGAEVKVVEVLEQILPIEDKEVSQGLARSLKRKGIEIQTGAAVQSLKREGSSVQASIRVGEDIEQWRGDYCLVAIGVEGNVDNLGLEKAGVKPEKSFIITDSFCQTSVPGIYAIGDVTGPPLLAHVASHQGIIAAEHISGLKPHPIDYSSVPGCTYCQPQVASIGLTEAAAEEKGVDIAVGKFPFTASGKAVASGKTDGFVKVVMDKSSEEVLGIHILHAEATELIGEGAVIMSHEGIASSVLNTIHAHPTLSESIMEAMGNALGRAVHT